MERFGDRPAIITGQGELSYRDFVGRADQMVDDLPSRGLIFLECANTVDVLATFIGCLRSGRPVHLFADLEEAALTALVASYDPHAVVRVADGGIEPQIRHRQRLLLHPELQILLSTSGSTGSPKFVKLSRTNVVSNAAAIAEYLELSEDDRAITSLKLNYSYGMSVVTSHLAVGAALVLSDASVIQPVFWQEFIAGGATSFAGVPYTFEMLANNEEWASTPGLRRVTQAGGKLAPDIVRRLSLLGRRAGWDFFVMYGQTEASPRIAYLPPEQAAENPDCVGRAIPGGALSLIDEAGAPIAATELPGELRYEGPNVMLGYATDASGLASDETPPFLLTGDIAVRTENGFYRIVGRTSRFIKPFGIRINLDEVQAIVRRTLHNAVCTGDDTRIVIASERFAPDGFAADLAATLHLPQSGVTVLQVTTMPLLPNGKSDYQRIKALAGLPTRDTAVVRKPPSWFGTFFSGAFLAVTMREFRKIVGLSSANWQSVTQIFTTLLAARPVLSSSTFFELSGDSLAYIQTLTALEDYLGEVPEEWGNMTLAQLENMHDKQSAL
jgi:acyl-CoA synthetase (AMP-forming)/AMP-acid ligase II